MPKRNHLETQLQMACVRWFAFEYPNQKGCLFMVNNESRSAQEMAKNKKMGLTPGVADLLYLSPKGKLICIEMKYGAGRQSKNQKIWQKAIEAHGAEYNVVSDFSTFMNLIKRYNI